MVEIIARVTPIETQSSLDSLPLMRKLRTWSVVTGPSRDSITHLGRQTQTATPNASTSSSTSRSISRARIAWNWLLWIVTVLVHLLSTLYYSTCAHLYNALPSTILSVNMRAFGLSIDPKHFPVLVMLHALCATLHALLLLEMLLYSLWFRRLLFTHEAFLRSTNQLHRTASLLSTASTCVARARKQWLCWFGPNGVFGVDRSYYPALFLAREICEIALQSYQAFKMSHLVPRMWLNKLYVALITMNCWSTPVLTEFVFRLHHRRALRMCIFVDVVLDFVSTIGVPTVLAIPYLQAYNPHTTDFREEFWNSDEWYVSMVNELRMLFIQSWTDCAAQFAFCTSLLMCLDDLKILASSDADFSDRTAAPLGPRALATLATATVAPAPASEQQRQPTTAQAAASVQRASETWRNRLSKCGHIAMVLWGLVVAIVHLEAQRDVDLSGCLVHVHPWLSPKTACSLLFVDCLSADASGTQLLGSAPEIESSWAGINEDLLGLLTIANCPALRIPASIEVFSNLMGLNLLNVTVVEWSTAAALTRTRHPNMRHLGLLFVDFSPALTDASSVFPPGLLAHDFPPLLRDVFILECYPRGLPEGLHTAWPTFANMLLPANAIEVLPSTLLHMQPMRIMLDANMIATIPLEVFAIDSLMVLELSYNPIDVLPELLPVEPFALGGSLAHLNIKGTNVLALPAWMATPAFLSQVTVRAGGTPLCAKLLDPVAAGDAESQRIAKSIDCTP